MNNKKILFVSSSGGHFQELMKLKQTMNQYKSFIIVEKSKVKSNENIYGYLLYGSRNKLFHYCIILIINMFKSLYFLIKINPQIIITTGAHTCFFLVIFGKLFRKKIIYIESYARVNSESLTYKLIKNFIDITIVQHEELQNKYINSYYFGGVY